MKMRQMKKKLKKQGIWNVIVPISQEETNSFYDPERSNNGGGYSQPYIEFTFNGKKGVYYDSSCGEFGGRYDVELGNKCSMWGLMYRETGQEYSNFSETDRKDRDFCMAFMEWQGFRYFPTKEDFKR